MRLLFFNSIFLFWVSFAQAFTVEPSASLTALNTYSVANIEAEYDLSGGFYRLDALFDFGDGLLLLESPRYFWGLSLGYGSFKGDLEDTSLASASLASSAQFDLYVPYFILGLAFSEMSFKFLLTPHIHIRENEGVTQGDEKYGYGGGVEIGYKAYEHLSLNIGYHYYMCDRGKNSSTGQSGTLSNDVTLSFLTVGLSFPFRFDGMGRAPESPYRRGRSGVR